MSDPKPAPEAAPVNPEVLPDPKPAPEAAAPSFVPQAPDPLTREGVLADFPGLSDVQIADELRHRKGVDR